MNELKRLQRRLLRQLRTTAETYRLFAPGDRVLVCVSGGKDSYALLDLLLELRSQGIFQGELIAAHLDQGQPGYDGAPLARWLEQSGARFEILREDTYSVVTEKLAPGSTYCSLCSRLRRGILYTAAERLGCNKLALGHHRDDALETFLLNVVYGGKLQAMPASYRTDDGRFEVLRPLIEVPEAELVQYAALRGFPLLPCNLCGSQEGLQREAMAELLTQLERSNPHVRSTMLNALRNVRPSHLLDPEVAQAWRERDPSLRPAPEAPRRPAHAHALPVLRGGSSPEERVEGLLRGHHGVGQAPAGEPSAREPEAQR